MDAFVSGIAARVVFVEGDEVSYMEADEPDVIIRSSTAAIPHLLAGAYDVEELIGVNKETVLASVLEKWSRDRALRLLQLTLDCEEEWDVRTEAAEYLAALLRDKTTVEFARNWAYAVPLFCEVNLREIKRKLGQFAEVVSFIDEIVDRQRSIVRFRKAWDAIDSRCFAGNVERKQFELKAVQAGLFRMLAEAGDDPEAINGAVVGCFLALQSEPNSRAIITEWTKNVITRGARKRLRQAADEAKGDVAPEGLAKPARFQRRQSHQKYQEALRQIDGIRQCLGDGKIAQARRYTEQLVKWQLRNGGPDFAAKSLCALAQDAKRLGQHSLQLEWARRATQVAPEDGWAHGQVGDAYMALYRFDEAQQAYQVAGHYGDKQFALTGSARLLRAGGRLDQALAAFAEAKQRFPLHPEAHRAWAGYSEVLRDMWRFEEALASYDEAVDRFPTEQAIWCGRAAVLKDMGNLEEAKQAYSAAVNMFPDSAVPYGGRADVLKTMGELDAALSAYEDAISMFPQEPVLLCGRADVLRAMGRLGDALLAYLDAKHRFPYEPSAFSGYAEVLRDDGRLEEAVEAYDDAVRRFPFEARCMNGRANVLRVAGRFTEALQAYDKSVREFPYDLFALSGRANLLKELGRAHNALAAYDVIMERRPDYKSAKYSKAAILATLQQFNEAEALLPDGHPGTSVEWIAYHIRGMIRLRTGRLEEALDIFTRGALLNPFFKERKFFENGLTATRIRMGQFEEAEKITRATGDLISNVLRLHSCSEIGRREEALKAFSEVPDNSPPPIVILRNELAARYKLVEGRPRYNDQWIFDQEADVLLQAA